MTGGISIHVYDVSRGVPAAGLRVELRDPDGKLLVDAQTANPGTLDGPTPDLGFVTKSMSPAEFTAFVANQVKSFQTPVKASGAKL
jgi:5-hydroxyisourate hydrolase-like protein (transthyretin family)